MKDSTTFDDEVWSILLSRIIRHSFPHIDGMYFSKRRFLGEKRTVVPAISFKMEEGVIYPIDDVLPTSDLSLQSAPRLSELAGLPIYTLDQEEIGTAVDFLLSFRMDRPLVESVVVQAASDLRDRLAEATFTLPGERLSLKESKSSAGETVSLVAHVRMSEQTLGNWVNSRERDVESGGRRDTKGR